MSRIMIAAAAAVVFTGTAMGQSTIAYTLQLGSNNHVADWENPTRIINTAFTPGTAADDYAYDMMCDSGPITWSVVAAVSGIHSGDNLPTLGIANLVFNLTLKDAFGNPVSSAVFFSTMNDGDHTGARYLSGGSDPLEKAAFCLGWDVDMDYNGLLDGAGPPVGAGRLFDPVSAGGPFMDSVQFPSTSSFGGGYMSGGEGGYVAVGPMATDVPAGTLAGMAIGYSQFVIGQSGFGVGLALGSVFPDWGHGAAQVGVGARPVAEGQIDPYSLLDLGYTLELTVPTDGQGHPVGQNIILGSYNPYISQDAFAAPADVVITDSIAFRVDPVLPCIFYRILSWSSVRTQTGVGDLGITLNASDDAATVEPRSGGIQKLKVVFDGDLTWVIGQPGPIQITGTPGLVVTGTTFATTAVPNDTLVITLAGSTDKAYYSFNLSGLGVCFACENDPTCSVAVVAGDVSGDGNVTVIDVMALKNQMGTPVDSTNARYDVNCDGVIDYRDWPVIGSTAVPLSWKSVKTHGSGADAVELSIALNATSGQNATSEPRSGRTGDPRGIEKLRISFSGAPELVVPLPATFGSPAMNLAGLTIDGNDLVISLTGCIDHTCYTFDLSGVISNLMPLADPTCKVVAMIGDANNGGSVTTTDYTAVKNALNQPATDTNCRLDMNCGKTITTTDYTVIKNKITTGSVACVN